MKNKTQKIQTSKPENKKLPVIQPAKVKFLLHKHINYIHIFSSWVCYFIIQLKKVYTSFNHVLGSMFFIKNIQRSAYFTCLYTVRPSNRSKVALLGRYVSLVMLPLVGQMSSGERKYTVLLLICWLALLESFSGSFCIWPGNRGFGNFENWWVYLSLKILRHMSIYWLEVSKRPGKVNY